MKFDKKIFGKDTIPYTVAACSAVVLYLALSHIGAIYSGIKALFGYIQPVFWAVVIAYVVDPLVVVLQRSVLKKLPHRQQRIAAIVLTIIAILAFMVLFSVALFPQLINSISVLVSNLGGYVRALQENLDTASVEIAGFTVDISTLIGYGERLLERLTSSIQENIVRILNTSVTIGKSFLNGVITCILAVYFLLAKERLRRMLQRLLLLRLTDKQYRRLVRFGQRCNRILIRFIACDLLDGLAVGIINFVFMSLLGMPYAILVSVLVGVANLVPTFGPIAGGAGGAFILLLADPRYVLWFLIFTFILQLIDGYVIKPNFYGDSLGASPLWVLVSVIVGGRVAGVAGIMLGIPFAAISDYIFREFLWPRLERNRPSA